MSPMAELQISGFCGPGLYFQIDGFRLIYLGIAVLMWGVAGIFSLEYMAHYRKKGRYYTFFLATFFATVGVFLSADFYTTFIFFEIMSFTSYVWVAFDERRESLRAAETYLAVAVIGGMGMLMGLFLLYDLTGTLRFDELGAASRAILNGSFPGREVGSDPVSCALGSPKVQLYTACGLLLFGFGAKAGCFPLHIWLPKAHPVAPAPASALLSGILTKAGVFGIIVVSCGMLGRDLAWGTILACLGLITMFLGALLALFSVNLKRTLACSSVSQIGFILTGIGMSGLLGAAGESSSLAVRGTFLHMVNHSLFKLVLFLCAAAVFMNLHQLELNDIRGFGRKKPLLMFCFLMGALGIGGMPLWSGYVSKTLLHESIVEYGACAGKVAGMLEGGTGKGGILLAGIAGSALFWQGAEWIFLISGGMTVAYMAKLFVALFADRHPVRQAEFDAMSSYMNRASQAVLVGASLLLPLLGMSSHRIMDRLGDLGQDFFGPVGHGHPVAYFSMENLKGAAISLGIGLCLYGLVVRRWMMKEEKGQGMCYVDRWPGWLDLEELVYRPILQSMLPGVWGFVCGFIDRYVISVPVTVFLSLSAVVCRAMDQAGDVLIRTARQTTHRQIPYVPSSRILAGDPKMDASSLWGNRLAEGRKRSGLSEERKEKRRRTLVRMREQILRNGRLVEESFSFGLMLFAVGLCLTLGYLLLVFISR